MKIVHKDQTKEFKNSETCTAIEYPMDDKDINGAVINLKCKEMAYVIKGSGKIIIEEKGVELKEGDLVLVEPGEKYFWEGNLVMFVPCTPAWHPEQHKEVE